MTKRKRECQAATQICSGELIRQYGVNGSEKSGELFNICGPCVVYLKKGGSKFKEVAYTEEPTPEPPPTPVGVRGVAHSEKRDRQAKNRRSRYPSSRRVARGEG